MMLSALRINGKKRRGFTLIELAIVLAITSLLTVGLWRMMSSGNTQLRDQAAADQHKQLIAAVRAYLASQDGQTQLTAQGSPFNIPLDCAAPFASFCTFLPAGFDDNTVNAYGQTYGIGVTKDTAAGVAPTSFAFMIKTFGGETIPDTSGGRISSLIGGDGGFVYEGDICNNPGVRACGAFGSWNALPSGFGLVEDGAGRVASRTFVGGSAELNTPWLARLLDNFSGMTAADGIQEFNTIQTDISLAGNSLFGIGDGTGDYGGEIIALNHLDLGRNENEGIIPLRLDGNCSLETASPCDLVADVNGDIGVTGQISATAIFGARYIYNSTLSDIRLKKEFQPIGNALDKLSKIKGYQFVEKDTGKVKYGVIAQEVEQVFPHVVQPIDNNYKGVDYMGLVGPLVAAINELRTQNDELKAEMEALKKKLDK